MSYVPGFINDIFISFSHLDNWEGWVDEFQRHLENRLLQLDVEVTIWRDKKLRGTDVFSDEIFTQLQQSALLISIISPQGFKSHWCQDERETFEHFAALNGGLRVGNHLRAIKVVKTPLPNDEHRDLFGVTGFEFYEREKQSDRFREFDQTSPEFRQKRNEMALDIKSVLETFRQHLTETPKKTWIYVATTSSDLNRSRDRVVQQLEDWGYAVVPKASEPPRRFASFQAVAKAQLAASIFSIHLVGDQRQSIEDEKDSITAQYEFAQTSLKDRIVWVGPSRQLYPELDDALNRDLERGVDILRDRTIDDLNDVLEEKLNRRRREPQRTNNARIELYLICDHEDHPWLDNSDGAKRALEVKEYLDENGLVVKPPPFSEMEWNDLEQAHGAELQFSNAVMLYWGMASENWFLKSRRIIISEEMRRKKTSNAGPLTVAFYFSNPPMKKTQYRRLAEFVFEQYGEFEPDDFQPLLDRLLTNEEGT